MQEEEQKKKILCIIPARGGSKGVKKKNVRLLGGMPLIGWTIEGAKKSRHIDRIVVSTEDEEICEVSKRYGIEVIKRPVELAQDASSSSDVVLHVVNTMKRDGYTPDHILLLQCTSPFRTVSHIDEAIDKYLHRVNEFDSLISVVKTEHPPWWLKTIDRSDGLADFLTYDKNLYIRRQDFPEVYQINGAIYIVKTKAFYEYKMFQTPRTLAYIMDLESSVDIDTETDFLLAEGIMKKNLSVENDG